MRRCAGNDSLVSADALLPDRGDHCLIHPVRGAQLEFLALLIEHVNCAAISRR